MNKMINKTATEREKGALKAFSKLIKNPYFTIV